MTNNGPKVFIVEGKRTPFGKFGGSLKDIKPVDLAVLASKALLEAAKISPSKIDQVLLGNVVPSSTDTMYGGRHLALKIGANMETPGVVINRLCGSGIQVIIDGARLIKTGEAQVVLAAGTENMSMIPHLLYGARFGTKYGSPQTVDMLLDALSDQYAGIPMGVTAENLAKKYGITREQSDQFSFDSHQKASMAYSEGKMQEEIVSVELRKGKIDRDEHLRDQISLDEISKLRTVFDKNGVVTAASSSGVVDGAAAVLLASEEFVNLEGTKTLCEIVDFQVIGVDPEIMGIGPVPAIKNLLLKNNLSINDIDLFEINEAFSAQCLSVQKELEIPSKKLNIWGGAIALGHPLGASGTRICLTLARQLKDQGKKIGIASACIGGGQGIAIMIRV